MSNRVAGKVIGSAAAVVAGGALAAGSSSNGVSTSLPGEQEAACSRLEAWPRGGSNLDQRGDGSSTDNGGGQLIMGGQRHLNLRLRDAYTDGDVEGDLTAALSNLARSDQGRSVMEMGINIARDEPFQREMMDRLGIGPEALQEASCGSSSTVVSAAEDDQSLLMIQPRTIDRSSSISNHHHLLMEIESLRSRLQEQTVEQTEKDERIQDLDELVKHLMLQNDRLMDRIGDSSPPTPDASIRLLSTCPQQSLLRCMRAWP